MEDASEDFNEVGLTHEYQRGDELFTALTDTANKVGYTLYPIDVPGLRTENFGADIGSSYIENIGLRSSSREQQLHNALRYMATETGGKALFAHDRVASLSAVRSDTRSYYWLGFTPAQMENDDRHGIKVRLGNKDYKVRFRQDYVDSSRGAEASMAVESALLFGGPNDEAAFPVEFGEPKRAGIGKIEVPLSVAVPLDHVTVLPTGGQWMVRLELRIAVIDDAGGRSDVPVIAISLDLDKQPQPEDFGMYRTILKLRNSKHRIVLALYDVATGKALMTPVDFDPK